MKNKKKSGKEAIDSTKSVIIEFPEKDNPRIKTLGLIQEIRTNGRVIVDLKPIVYQSTFEGDNIKLGLPYNPEEFMAMIKKFESSEHEVLVISGKKAYPMSRKQFNGKLESMLHKMVTKKYLQELHKKPKEGYVV